MKAALQNTTSNRKAKYNMNTFTNDGNMRMQSVPREFVSLLAAFCEGKSNKIRMV